MCNYEKKKKKKKKKECEKQTAALFQADPEKAVIINGTDVSLMNEQVPAVKEKKEGDGLIDDKMRGKKQTSSGFIISNLSVPFLSNNAQ